jgi:hypothetical protein
MGEDYPRGHPRTDNADLSSESGWVTTDVAARAVRVSPRTIRRYIDQGKLEAKPQGEGVRREWLVSIDSLQALRAKRPFEGEGPLVDRAGSADDAAAATAAGIADVVREMAARLESRAEEAAELRARLELTERTQSTLADERRRALQELEEERGRREEAEREREKLRRELEALREDAREPPQGEGAPGGPVDGPAPAPEGAPREVVEKRFVEQQAPRRGFWSRLFGGQD